MYQSKSDKSKSDKSIKKIANVCSIVLNECRDLVNQNKNTGCGSNGGGDGWDDDDGTTWMG